MLNRIDEIIYPSRCEVIELHDLNRFIYPIYKNGSTVLTQCLKYKFKTIVNEQIKKAPEIEIILRNPVERFISGINSFIYSLKEENPNLDTDTIIYFVENYLFLNRHYAPQLSWLINLSKYINKNTKLKFFGMNELDNLTNKLDHPEIKILSAEKIEQLKKSEHNEMYIRLDNSLLDLIGQSLTFNEVIAYLKEKDPKASEKLKCTALD